MRSRFCFSRILPLLAAFASTTPGFAQGTAFTYQGRLNDGTNAAGGIYDLRFTIYDSTNNPGVVIAGPLTNAATSVSNPDSPVCQAVMQMADGVTGLSSSANLLAAAEFRNLTFLDVTTPSSPVVRGVFRHGHNGIDFLYGAYDVAFAGTNLVASGTADGSMVILAPVPQQAGLAIDRWVGVGTTVPAAPLHVKGNVIVEDAELISLRANRTELGVDTAAHGDASIAMGQATTASGWAATAMGYGTVASSYFSTAMGGFTTASGFYSTAMGYGTIANGFYSSSTAMGHLTTASGNRSTAMGANTTASGDTSTAMGSGTIASGDYSTAIGNLAQAIHQGAFVWGDSSGAFVSSSTNDEFTVRASGGARFFSDSGLTTGVTLAPGSGSWSAHRNAKENFVPVDGRAVLEKLANVPLSSWNYRAQDSGIRHLGPMAQDFRAAFGLGENDTSIATVDADGVALAAIQGLNQKLEKKETEITELKHELAELKNQIHLIRRQLKGDSL